MAIINWNSVEFEVDQTWALCQFVQLIEHARKFHFLRAYQSLDTSRRGDIDWLLGLNPSPAIDARSSLADLVRAMPAGSGVDQIDGLWFQWTGDRTVGRSVALSCHSDGRCVVELSTGTGQPSRFLDAWCRQVARQVLREVDGFLAMAKD